MMLSLLKVRWGCLILLLKLARVYVELKLLLQSAFQGIFILLFNGITKIKTIGKEVVLCFTIDLKVFLLKRKRGREIKTLHVGVLYSKFVTTYTHNT